MEDTDCANIELVIFLEDKVSEFLSYLTNFPNSLSYRDSSAHYRDHSKRSNEFRRRWIPQVALKCGEQEDGRKEKLDRRCRRENPFRIVR